MTATKNTNELNELQDQLANQLLKIQSEILIFLSKHNMITNDDFQDIFGSKETLSIYDWNQYKKLKKWTIQDFNQFSTMILDPQDLQWFEEKMKDLLYIRMDLIRSFIPLIHFLARRYVPYHSSMYPELKGEGYIGLLKSLDSFYYVDLDKHIKKYVEFYIKQEMRRFLLENRQGYKIPYMASLKQRMLASMGGNKNPLEISDVQYFSDISSYHNDFESQLPSTLKEPIFENWEKFLEETLQELLKTLSYKEKEVLELHYGLSGNHKRISLEKIGSLLGFSKEGIRQIEHRAIKRLQKKIQGILEKEDIEDFF